MQLGKQIGKLQAYWRDEMEVAAIYDRLAQEGLDEEKRQLIFDMRETERHHAKRWEERIRELGGELPPPPLPWKARWLSWPLRLAGQQHVFQQFETVERQAVAG